MTVVTTHGVSKDFGTIRAVDNISMAVDRGEIVGLLGANGAGKTTLMRMLLGLLPASAGRVETLGQPAGHIDHRAIGYVPQSLGLYPDLTVRENLDFIASAFGVDSPALDPELDLVSEHRVDEIPLGLRRRTAFVAARCHSPEILILDEPTSGVGPLGRAELWDTIHDSAEDGAAVLISTHYMEEAEECDRVIVMSKGSEVASGHVSDIIGGLRSVAVSGVTHQQVERLRIEGMTVLPDGVRWRVVDGDAARVREVIGDSGEVESVPATFEEAFVEMSS